MIFQHPASVVKTMIGPLPASKLIASDAAVEAICTRPPKIRSWPRKPWIRPLALTASPKELSVARGCLRDPSIVPYGDIGEFEKYEPRILIHVKEWWRANRKRGQKVRRVSASLSGLRVSLTQRKEATGK